MLHFLWIFTIFIVTLGILITVHELGHFLIARCCGVTVERFSIGFGRAILRLHDKSGTEYVIAAIPIGGYVKMLDKRTDNIVAIDFRHKNFYYKSIWQRATIIIAGPLFNFIFSIFIYWLVFIIGMPSYRPVIGDVIPRSVAAKAKILPKMEIKSVDDIETPDWDSVRIQLLTKIGDCKTTISVVPFGSLKREQKTLDLSNWQYDQTKEDAIVALGIVPFCPSIELVLAEVYPGYAAIKAGLQVGDKIITVNDHIVNSWQMFVKNISENPGIPLKVTVNRNGKMMDITLQPDSKHLSDGYVKGFIGVVPKIIPISADYKIVHQYGPLKSMIKSVEKTWQVMRITVSTLSKLLTGEIHLRNLSGPISIAKGAEISAEYGFIHYMIFIALISINLGILNLIPLPNLDGGHLLFLSIEKVKGAPLSEPLHDIIYRIGSILLIILMGLAIFNDFSRI